MGAPFRFCLHSHWLEGSKRVLEEGSAKEVSCYQRVPHPDLLQQLTKFLSWSAECFLCRGLSGISHKSNIWQMDCP